MRDAAGLAKGAGVALKHTVDAVRQYTNPITAGPAYVRGARDAYSTYKGQGFREAFNQHYNPAYAFLVSQHLCRTAKTSYDRGYACTSAVRDAALLAAVGAGACRPAIAFGKSSRGVPRLAGGAPTPAEIIRPGGNPIGRPGKTPGIRELPTQKALDDLFDELRVHGAPTRSRYPGVGYDLPDGGFVGRRESKQYGPTLDIKVQGIEDVSKIHVK
jgi:hypothetical protein